MSLWRSDAPLALVQISTLNANMATLDQIKEVLWGKQTKIIWSSINWQQILKNFAKQSNSLMISTTSSFLKCSKQTWSKTSRQKVFRCFKGGTWQSYEMCYRCDVPNWRNRPIRAQRLSGNFGYKTLCRVHIIPIVKEEISIAHQIPSYKADVPLKIIVTFTWTDIRNRF